MLLTAEVIMSQLMCDIWDAGQFDQTLVPCFVGVECRVLMCHLMGVQGGLGHDALI